MTITQLTRLYRRSESFKRPDGTEMWIAHEMSATAQLDESDKDRLAVIGQGLEEICRKEVAVSLKAEKAKINAALNPVADEPFPGKTPGMDAVRKMPKL